MDSETHELFKAMGITDEWRIENIKDTAMARCNVAKGKRPHIRRVLDEAFTLLRQQSPSKGNAGQ